ncbi:hypothetical protein K1W69_03715 [Hoeflea sp. WL0058]|uniref:Porin domain-containing protein n=1 Tax=Flavimaribacter sediminis TaxID=2865987 RepID=A0AAE2ZKK2_9HYPH|nr:hypothetical protein [Flavimaribacter sediminis]MBW8636285.1 hypothetical protein [Flavimaribacter sediminis]
MKRSAHRSALLALAAASAWHGAAHADDPVTLSTEDLVDDEAVVTQSVRPRRLLKEAGFSLRFYGHLNKALLSYDDGASTRSYFPVDNWGSESRFGFQLKSPQYDDWQWTGKVEFGWAPYSTKVVNQDDNPIDWDPNLRKAEFYVVSETYGTVWLGQGSMASDGSAEIDLSNTALVGQSRVERIAGGQLYRLADGSLSDIEVRNTFENMDGFGRRLRFRYDTPSWNGFILSGSIGETIVPDRKDNLGWDVALRYAQKLGPVSLSGAVAWSQTFAGDETIIDGSVSALHDPSGISLTLAAAERQESGQTSRYAYGKLGYQVDWFEFGKTAFSVDAYFGDSIYSDDDISRSYGFQFVQDVKDWETKFYVGVRNYRYEATDASYRDGLAVITGAFVKF